MEHAPEPIPSGGGGSHDATLLLERVHAGDPAAAADLLPIVYDHLRSIAGGLFRAERADHTLQPTALVHEAYVKLINQPDKAWDGREHFAAVASLAMRQILTDHARARRASKRDAGGKRVPLTVIDAPSGGGVVDVLALDELLSKLAEMDERGARVVELRFFGGLTNEQTARVLGVSTPTVARDWRRGRAWLETRLEDGDA